MQGWLNELLARLAAAPEWLMYGVLGLFAALENLVPPIPADVVVLFGSLLAARGAADPWLVFGVVWASNVGGALLVYALGRRYGLGFFRGRIGGWILRPSQLQSLSGFYHRFGFGVILVSRFLPMFRAVVPVFAGVAGIGFARTALPVAAASGIWYGMLVYVGSAAGRNWGRIVEGVSSTGRWLWVLAAVAALAIAAWWWRSRNE